MYYRTKLLPLLLIIFSSILYSQSDDVTAYKNTAGLLDKTQRIEALQDFLTAYPESGYRVRAFYDLFNIYADDGNEKQALEYAEKYLSTYPEEARMNRYNSVAYILAQNNIGLEPASEYAQKAVDMARNASPRSFRQILDTQAYVLYRLGDVDSALVLEREAIKGNEDSPSYLYYLSIYEEATGNINDALMHSAEAVLNGDGGDALIKFNEWIDKSAKSENDRKNLRTKIINEVVSKYLANNNEDSKVISNSNAAAFMAKMKSNLKDAEKLAMSSLKSVNDKTSIEELILLKNNMALVYSALDKNEKAINELKTIENLASPYDSDFWLTLGNSYAKSGKVQKSLDAYVNGLMAFSFPKVMSAAESLIEKNNIDPKILNDRINQAKEDALNFEPGKYRKKNKSGRVVLAELFTGAECPPCVASDMAFDKLSEYFPRTDLAILEYHVHIPGPDPMTNPDTFKRYKYYGGNFGTPTVFFDGQDKMVGGGANYVAKNRFKVYEQVIEKYLTKKPELKISGSASINNNDINVMVNISKSLSAKTGELSLHIALAERSISYTGANGIDKHIFVVRDLLNGPDGEALKLTNSKGQISQSVNLTNVVNGIKKYLDNPAADESWRAGAFNGWKERTDKVNPDNLAVVIWVQDNNTKEIVQSYYTDVTPNVGTN